MGYERSSISTPKLKVERHERVKARQEQKVQAVQEENARVEAASALMDLSTHIDTSHDMDADTECSSHQSDSLEGN